MVSFLHSSRLSSGHSSGLPSGPSIQHPARRAPFSFADDLLDQTQPVNVTLWGFEYPGEVIVAERWRAEFGEALSGVSMFRLVLLHTPEAPTPDDIADDRICVAAPRVSSQMIGETRATYLVDGAGKSHSERSSARPGQQDGRNLFATDLRTLREVRQNYITANDPGLGRLASALAMFESQANASVAADLHKMWKTGVVVTSNHRTEEGKTDWTGPKIQPGELFLLEDPESWIESAAAVLDMGVISGIAGAFGISGDLVSPVRIYDELKNGRLADARVHLRQLCGIQIDELTPGDQIKALVENGDGEVSGDALIQLLIHELRYPPAIASLWLVVHALDSGGELVLFEAGAGRVDTESAESRREYLQGHLSGDTISEFEHDADLITRTMNFRSEKSGDWDAVLPFLRLVAPEANFTAFGGGRDSDSIEFGLQLEALHGRLRQAKPAMLRLEVAVGSTDHPLTRISEPLKKVLSVESWQEYVVRAREIYGSVGALRTALNDAAHQWSATEYSPDIERTVYYLDQVEFGRGDHALAVEHRALRSRFDLTTLIENPSRWRALRSEFERWRQEYRKAYLEDHSLRQERDRTLHDKIERTTRRVVQLGRLERIYALRDRPYGGLFTTIGNPPSTSIPQRWDRVVGTFRVCDRDGSEILLIDGPVCTGCKGRLGQVSNHIDVVELITEVNRVFETYRDRLAVVVADLVLNAENSDRLQKLFRLNSAGDLSDLANVLDDKVISFLNELFGNTDGNLDDWTLPHS